MSCSPFDLKDYVLQELPLPQRQQTEAHLKTCQTCREELDRLSLTQAMLGSLRDEEIPQRIAFVSDKIFEPSPWRRAWSSFWGSSAKLGFAAAAMLSASILFSAATRPVPIVASNPPVHSVTTVADSDIQQRIQAAVDRAVAESEARQSSRTQQLASALESTRQHLQLVDAEYDYSQRRDRINHVAAAGYDLPVRSVNGDAK